MFREDVQETLQQRGQLLRHIGRSVGDRFHPLYGYIAHARDAYARRVNQHGGSEAGGQLPVGSVPDGRRAGPRTAIR